MKKEYKEAFKNFFVLLLLALGISVSGYLVVKQAINNKEKSSSVEEGEKIEGKLDKTQLAMKINSKITIEDSTSKGKFGIENKSNNVYDMVVKIYLKETNELIYESPMIKPGEKIDEAKLDKKLEKGTYKAIAYFEAYEKEKQQGKSGIEIEILVKN